MLPQLRRLAQTGLQRGFLNNVTANNDASPVICEHGPLTSNLFYHFRHEWIKSFARHSCGRYNFLWLESFDQYPSTKNVTIGWQQKIPEKKSDLPLIIRDKDSIDDDALCIRYLHPIKDITMIRLADERTRFWKKYFNQRERLECISSKQNQFHINYRLETDLPPYELETIQLNADSSFDLTLNINQTLVTLLIDSQMQYLHPLLTAHQITIETDAKAVELYFYLSKLLSLKYQLRVLRVNGEKMSESIPFRLVLNENSLKNGLCTVWSRDTQLTEEIHVKQVAKRLADYFKALDDVL